MMVTTFGALEMAEYIYKGFKVHYDIEKTEITGGLFQAQGYVICDSDTDGPTLTQKFQTESSLKSDVEHEIKKIINHYIDFEWKQYLKMRG